MRRDSTRKGTEWKQNDSHAKPEPELKMERERGVLTETIKTQEEAPSSLSITLALALSSSNRRGVRIQPIDRTGRTDRQTRDRNLVTHPFSSFNNHFLVGSLLGTIGTTTVAHKNKRQARESQIRRKAGQLGDSCSVEIGLQG